MTVSLEGRPTWVKWFRKAQTMQNWLSTAPENQIKQFPFPTLKILDVKKKRKINNKNAYDGDKYVSLNQDAEDPYAVAQCEQKLVKLY